MSPKEWIAERMDNCERIAHSKTGLNRKGWLQDAAYFKAALEQWNAAEAILSEREKELAEWRDIKEQMRCLTIYSKRDLQAKVATQVRLREAAEKELARGGKTIEAMCVVLRCSLSSTDPIVLRRRMTEALEIAARALSPSQESSA